MRFAIIDRWAGGSDGPSVYVREFARGLLEDGHEPSLFFDERRGSNAVNGMQERQIPGLSRHEADTETRALLRGALAAYRPDAVVAECIDVPWFAPEIRSFAPLVLSLHTHTLTCPNWSRVLWKTGELCERDYSVACGFLHYWGGCGRGGGLRTLLTNLRRCSKARSALRDVDGVHALNTYMAGTFRRAGIPEDKIFVSQYPAPLFDEGKAWVESGGSSDLILFVGRLDQEKGGSSLLQACAALDVPFRLRFLGSPALDPGTLLKESLPGLPAAGRIEFLEGTSDRASVSRHFGEAAIVAVPSIWGDPSPLVRLEAMAHGRPVVAFDSGGVSSVIDHQVTGLVVSRGDIAGLSLALRSLLVDRKLAKAMGRAARRKVELEFTRRRHVVEMVAAFRRFGASRRASQEP